MNKTYIILSLLIGIMMLFTIMLVYKKAYKAGMNDTFQAVEDQCHSPHPLRINGHTYRCEFRY